ncbi:hypothetical protein FIBSPDRAFT_959179 [Athelia psychrophila]|uniref:MYND-type domain-containing protein n=1 Tax=Athelia psychrophila TaxID=1759441 RepID=A0A166DTA5_9AGAM|nr:hypothetical protein FIBSPDRAFT_959179 [Fibularhizoctonia sp. CBS 109695]
MRESNFAFPAQNRACVCITAQLYDRRALDTTSSLPLFNSLTHLTYLTSTSPRIREIMTLDGGLERLVRLLHAFCLSPPPPDNPAVLYGLSPPSPPHASSSASSAVYSSGARGAGLGVGGGSRGAVLNPASFDKHAAYRFSLAFQCVVNIGVRGSEDIRSRVVQAGTLEVVGCVLEAWLAGKGFAVGPSSSATGLPRETREQRMERRRRVEETKVREEANELSRALQRQIAAEQDGQIERSMDTPSSTTTSFPANSNPDSDADTSTDTSTNATPVRSSTPTGTVLVPGRERSGTVVAAAVWDPPHTGTPHPHAGNGNANHGTVRAHPRRAFRPSPDTSQPNTETEDDGDGDVDMDRRDDSPDPRDPRPRRADGIVSLEPNDDFAMGAPPGAPGAIEEGGMMRRDGTIRGRAGTVMGADATPRAGVTDLPGAGATPMRRDAATLTPAAARAMARSRTATALAPGDVAPVAAMATPAAAAGTAATATGGGAVREGRHHREHAQQEGPYRDEDVLLSLQLLAYLSKYPHVRQAFYKSRATFHPASGALPASAANAGGASSSSKTGAGGGETRGKGKEGGFFRAFSTNRGKEKEKEKVSSSTSSSSSTATTTPSSAAAPIPATATAGAPPTSVPSNTPAPRQTNVFSLVERFTFRPSSTETDLPNPPPKLPPEIQYWAGVIMRNACRKDDSRGGIRQCANMLCGKWETYPREFAKCRRCRKAKYCGKECQSTAWSEGHRFWCSVKEGDEDALEDHNIPGAGLHGDVPVDIEVEGDGIGTGRAERRAERERERMERERTQAGAALHNLPAGRQAGRPLLAPGSGSGSGAGAGAVNLDRALDRPVRTRAETVTGAGSGTAGGAAAGTSRYFPSTAGADAGPSRRRRGDDMPLD